MCVHVRTPVLRRLISPNSGLKLNHSDLGIQDTRCCKSKESKIKIDDKAASTAVPESIQRTPASGTKRHTEKSVIAGSVDHDVSALAVGLRLLRLCGILHSCGGVVCVCVCACLSKCAC